MRSTLAGIAALCALAVPVGIGAQTAQSSATKSGAGPTNAKPAWWEHALFYEVYPRSFQDSNGDGTGDLRGIEQRLDYLQQLGVDAIWIAPFYPSPQVDFGYDISDFKSIDPQYGTLADFDSLLAAAKRRGMRIVMDMILNHTSDKSAWFVESASSRTNPKADWYIWNDGIKAGEPGLSKVQASNIHRGPMGDVAPPNNWVSAFGGSSWAWSPGRKQFYYHKFYAQQPDLNWHNPNVARAMTDAMRFWLDRGVAGFRLDAIEAIFETTSLANDPRADEITAPGYSWNLPEVHDLMRHVRAMTDSYPGDRVLIGEVTKTTTPKLAEWYGRKGQEQLQYPMDYPYGFPSLMLQLGGSATDRLDIHFYRQHLLETSTQLNGHRPFVFFDNHDRERSADRFSDGSHPDEITRVVAALLLTVPAAAQMYYGQEIGMVTTTPTRREDVKDPVGRAYWPKNKGRDGERTPMQWTGGAQAGFSSNPATWLPIPPSASVTNVAVQSEDPTSLLNWYKALIALRRDNAAMRDGNIVLTDQSNEHVLSYIRPATPGARSALVSINMSASPQRIEWAKVGIRTGPPAPRTILSTPGVKLVTASRSVSLPPFGVWIADAN